MIPPKQQITADSGDVARIRNSVTCGESVQFKWAGNSRSLMLHLAQVMAKPYIPHRFEFDSASGICTVFPPT